MFDFSKQSKHGGLSIIEILVAGSILGITFMYIGNVTKVNNNIIRKTTGLTGLSDIEDEVAATMELAVMDTIARNGCRNIGLITNALNSYSLNLWFQDYSGGSTADFPCPGDTFQERFVRLCREVRPRGGSDFFAKYRVIVSGAYYFKRSTNLNDYINCSQIDPDDTLNMLPYGGDFFYTLKVEPIAGDTKPSYRRQYRYMRLDWKFLNFIRCLGRDSAMAKGLGECF